MARFRLIIDFDDSIGDIVYTSLAASNAVYEFGRDHQGITVESAQFIDNDAPTPEDPNLTACEEDFASDLYDTSAF